MRILHHRQGEAHEKESSSERCYHVNPIFMGFVLRLAPLNKLKEILDVFFRSSFGLSGGFVAKEDFKEAKNIFFSSLRTALGCRRIL
jgi:hypothetical protein